MAYEEDLVWQEESSKGLTRYKIRLEGGTLSTFYDPINSSYHLSFFPNQTMGAAKSSHNGKKDYAVVVLHSKRGIEEIHGDAKGILPGYMAKVKSLPKFPKNLSDGLEKLIEELNNTLD